MSAAETLLRHASDRFDVTILESKRMTGGRAGSFEDNASGETIDYCQHAAMGCCTNLLGLLQRCDLSDSMQRYKELRFLHPKFPVSRFAAIDWLPAPLHLSQTINGLNYLTWKQQRTVRRGLLRLMRTGSKKLVGVTAADWLSRAGQDAATIRDFWDVILVSALGESTEFVSMAAARKVMMDGFAAAHGASDVLVPSIPLGELIGERLTDAIASLGAEVVCESAATSVSSEPKGVATAAGLVQADHVVSAVPWHQLGRLVEGSPAADAIENLDAITHFPTSPITGLHLWFDREITDQPHHVMVGTLTQWLFRDPITRQSPEETSSDEHYYQVVISASHEARRVPKEELVQRVQKELRRAFPATSSARLIRSQIVTDPNAVFSIRPEVDAVRPPPCTALPWFHLAGDWIATQWPATMEGAVISGVMAAASVMQSENLPKPLPDPGLPRGWLARMLIKK